MSTAAHTLLFLSAAPLDTTPLDLDEELRAVQEERDRARLRDAFDLRPALAARIDDVRRKLMEQRPAVVHFGGHGSRGGGGRGALSPASGVDAGRGELLLVGEARRAAPVPIEALG